MIGIGNPVKSAGKCALKVLNRAETARCAMYNAHLRAIGLFNRSDASLSRILAFYRAHLKILEPFYSAKLANNKSAALAERCEIAWAAAVRAKLDAITDDAEARRVNTQINNFERERAMTRLGSYPRRMYLELTDACNLKCPMCTQAVMTHKRNFMPKLILDQMRPAFRFMDLISFVGCGETLVHPMLREMILALPSKRAETNIISNGILLKEDIARFLIEQELDHLWISLDSTNVDTYEQIRDSREFPKIIDNLKTIQRLKKEMGSEKPALAVNFVARRCNIEQLPDFMTMAHELGISRVNVGYLQVYSRDMVQESLFYHQELADRYIREARTKAAELGLNVFLPKPFSEKAAEEASPMPGGKCGEPYQFVFVHANGDVGPCCVNDSILGKLYQDPVDAIWNGDAYRRFRAVVSTPEQDMHCKHCMIETMKDIGKVEHHIKLIEIGKDVHRVEDVDYDRLKPAV